MPGPRNDREKPKEASSWMGGTAPKEPGGLVANWGRPEEKNEVVFLG